MNTICDVKLTQKQKITKLLLDYEWHHFQELNQICFRYGARLWELRQEGFDHEIKTIGRIKYYRFI